MTYNNLPIYIGQKNQSTIAGTVEETGAAIVAMNVSVDYPTQTNPKRLLGKSIDANDQFLFDGASEVGLSFTLLAHTSLPASSEQTYAFLTDHKLGSATGTNFFPVRVGNNLFGKCFLDNFSINARPFEPVTIDVKMTSYDPPRNHTISGDSSLPDSKLEDLLDSNKLAYGHTVSVSNADQVVSEKILSSISFSKTYSRRPIYKLGDVRASEFFVDTVDSEMRIESTGLERLIDHSGRKLTSDLTLEVKDYAGQQINPFGGALAGAGLVRATMSSGSRVTAQNYGIQGGETLIANATIREVIV
tara:strand:- start:32 stop:940 length:909 start_codon:yes stop_codon:yes gene_type:complete